MCAPDVDTVVPKQRQQHILHAEDLAQQVQHVLHVGVRLVWGCSREKEVVTHQQLDCPNNWRLAVLITQQVKSSSTSGSASALSWEVCDLQLPQRASNSRQVHVSHTRSWI